MKNKSLYGIAWHTEYLYNRVITFGVGRGGFDGIDYYQKGLDDWDWWSPIDGSEMVSKYRSKKFAEGLREHIEKEKGLGRFNIPTITYIDQRGSWE